ncbi:MAG: response regulator RpfG family c-di-GMP phosphodiesterase [Flavobacteriaceae bacterium]|jgi:response regulator RpfG family c-di-GMP phosphodiesterase
MSSEKIQVLYVDDERHNLTSFKATYRKEFKIHIAESAQEGLKLMAENSIQIVLSDQRMPEMTGVEFFAQLKVDYPDSIRILITGYSDIQAIIDAINEGQVYRYIAKPWDAQDLLLVIRQAHEIYSLREENAKLIEELKVANKQLEFLARQGLLS